jgi:hypothetical protein
MTEDEAFLLFIDKGNPIAKAMWRFRSECARMEQAEAQRKPPSQKARILMEYHAAKAIIEAAGLSLPKDPIHLFQNRVWFWDETWSNRHGPYRTRTEAEIALDAYVKNLG